MSPSLNSASTTLPLEDIITPSGVASWPPAIGWWLVIFLALGIIVFCIIFYRRYQKKWSYRKEALNLLNEKINQWQEKDLNDDAILKQLVNILKRTSISAYPSKKIESLHGKNWLDILRIQAPQVAFPQELTDYISDTQYQKEKKIDPIQLHDFCKNWIRQHDTQWHEMGVESDGINTIKIEST
ncbi:MAG: DUF4381 domain-containing protein [Cellvibrionaceae bacterium]